MPGPARDTDIYFSVYDQYVILSLQYDNMGKPYVTLETDTHNKRYDIKYNSETDEIGFIYNSTIEL